MLDFVIYNPKWSYNLLLYFSLLEKRDMIIYGQNFAISGYSVLDMSDMSIFSYPFCKISTDPQQLPNLT